MECPACMKWIVVPVLLALPMYSWLGCSQADTSGYRPASSHTNSNVSNEQSQLPSQIESSDNASTSTLPTASESMPSDQQDEAKAAELAVSALVPVNVVDGGNVRSVLTVPPGNSPSSQNESKPDETTKAGASTEPHKIELLVKEKSFRAEPKTGALRVSFDDLDLLKVLNMEPVVDNAVQFMPEWLRGLDNQPIRIRGFMYPTYDTEGIEHFVLARDNQICCFGRDPKIYDLIQVDMKAGKSTNYIPATRSFDVVGKFHIQMQSEDGKPFGLYVIDQAEVIDR